MKTTLKTRIQLTHNGTIAGKLNLGKKKKEREREYRF